MEESPMSISAKVSELANENNNTQSHPGIKVAATMDELRRLGRADAKFALQRMFTSWCGNEAKGQDCNHSECWKNAGVTDMQQQVELCEVTGIPIQAVFNIRQNNQINFRSGGK